MTDVNFSRRRDVHSVMQLVDQRKLTLDTPLKDLMDKPRFDD
jgi:hypothetical protein